jgi:hypothetical protein
MVSASSRDSEVIAPRATAVRLQELHTNVKRAMNVRIAHLWSVTRVSLSDSGPEPNVMGVTRGIRPSDISTAAVALGQAARLGNGSRVSGEASFREREFSGLR